MKFKICMVNIGILICILLLTGCGRETSGRRQPLAKNGVLDLRDWDFKKDGVVNLEGEWEFYWEKLLVPMDFIYSNQPELTSYVDFPQFWNKYKHQGKELGNYGFATYRIKVLLNDSNEKLAIKLFEINTAYKLFLNKKLLVHVGTVGRTPAESIPKWKTQAKPFQSGESTLEFIIQISNFDAGGAGVQRRILLGSEEDILNLRRISIVVSVFLCGIFLTIGFYHLLFFIKRAQEKAFLTIGFSAVCFCIYTICWYEAFFFELFPDVDWQIFVRIAWLSIVLLFFLLSWYCKSIFPTYFSDIVFKGIMVSFSVITGIILVLPIAVIFNLSRLIFFAEMVINLYCMYITVIAIRRNTEGAFFVFFGVIAWLFGVICIGLYGLGFMASDFSHLGFLIFILLQSVAVSFRFSNALNKSEKLSTELVVKNTRLLTLDKLKDDFLANTSHELRTPLNGIIGIAESLIDGAAGAASTQLKTNLSMIVSSGKRLSNLVNDILDFSKLKNHEIQIQRKPINIKVLADVVLIITRPLLAGKQIELINRISPDTPPVIGDENRLQQILINLVGNAIKFTEEGEITVSAAVRNSMVEVSVADTGIGIPKESINEIFRSFEQVDSSIEREYAGTGLGLSITKQLVELHGGELRVESTVGKGSAFTFSLPLSSEPAIGISEPVHEIQKLEEDEKEFSDEVPVNGSYHVLVVDDDTTNLQVLNNHLKLQGYQVTSALSGMEALDVVELNKPDIVLLDIMMPTMSGFEVCKKIRESYTSSQLPILFLTAKNQVSDLVEGFNVGASDYLPKPFSKNELLARVKTHLQISQQNSELEQYSNEMDELVKLRTQKLNETLNHVEIVNKKILDSIEYAKLIQNSLLPDTKQITTFLPNSFIVWKPRDIVGGDIYYIDQFEDGYLISVIDCTGHGVPGAFMTMIASSSLRRITIDEACLNPADILARLNSIVKKSLHQDTEHATSNDGLDASVCFVSTNKKTITYAGARLPLTYIQNDKVETIKGDRESIGYKKSDLGFKFTNHSIDIQEGMVFYLFTDGIIDQLGGEKRIPFGKNRLNKLLLKNVNTSFEEQQNLISIALEDYKGNNEMQDDVTVIGFSV